VETGGKWVVFGEFDVHHIGKIVVVGRKKG